MADLVGVLTKAVAMNASDIFILAGSTPMVRIRGNITPLQGYPALSNEDSKALIYTALSEKLRPKFEQEWELDYSFTVPNVSRFRVNIFVQRYGISAVYRAIPAQIPTPEQIGLTPAMAAVTDLPNGLVLVTGPTGCGKSTTLASLIEQINRKYRKNILTIEDPIEYIYENKLSVISQREVGQHTKSFQSAIRHAMRQNADVILIGEMRDTETMQFAITAAETGHLCFATLHTQDCASTVDRITDAFPSEQQPQIRSQLALTLRAVLTQHLLPRQDGQGRIAAREFMIMTSGISTLIRESKAHMISGAIETGKNIGMTTMDQNLAMLLAKGYVKAEDIFAKAKSSDNVKNLVSLMSGQQK